MIYSNTHPPDETKDTTPNCQYMSKDDYLLLQEYVYGNNIVPDIHSPDNASGNEERVDTESDGHTDMHG